MAPQPPRAARAVRGVRMQRYVCGSVDVVVPVAAVQQWSLPAQACTVVAIWAAVIACVHASVTSLLPWWATAAPGGLATARAVSPFVWGAMYMFIGTMHFYLPDAYLAIMPHRGAWGFWYLPGSPSFHIIWSGVVEVLVALGLVVGALPAVRLAAPALLPGCAAVLLPSTAAVFFANIYMFTHNAPTPALGRDGVLAPFMHVVRFVLEVVLLTTWWDLSHPAAHA